MFKNLLRCAAPAVQQPDDARRREITDKVFALMTSEDPTRFDTFDQFKATFDDADRAFFAQLVSQMQPVVEEVRQKVAAARGEGIGDA
jgi:hypothetical protein